jgi:hypothetical protein
MKHKGIVQKNHDLMVRFGMLARALCVVTWMLVFDVDIHADMAARLFCPRNPTDVKVVPSLARNNMVLSSFEHKNKLRWTYER